MPVISAAGGARPAQEDVPTDIQGRMWFQYIGIEAILGGAFGSMPAACFRDAGFGKVILNLGHNNCPI